MSSYSRVPKQFAAIVPELPDRQPPGLAKASAAWRAAPVSMPPSCRRPSPFPSPPPRVASAPPIHFPHENPFDDCHALPVPVIQNDPVPYPRIRLASQSFTVKMPRSSHLEVLVRQRTAQRLAQDREARCKAVAGILLNRVHAVGRPMRRIPPNPDAPRTYKRSRLSTMVTVDDL